MRGVHAAGPSVVRVSGRAQAELRAGEALVFDWIRLAICCAVAREVSLRRTTLREAQRSPAFMPLQTENGTPVFAHRRAYPMLVGRDIEVDCRRRLGVRSFYSSLPPDLGLRTSFGGGSATGPVIAVSLRTGRITTSTQLSASTVSPSERPTSP